MKHICACLRACGFGVFDYVNKCAGISVHDTVSTPCKAGHSGTTITRPQYARSVLFPKNPAVAVYQCWSQNHA